MPVPRSSQSATAAFSFLAAGLLALLLIALPGAPGRALPDLAWLTDPDVIEEGRTLFQSTCRDCHGSRANQSAFGQSRIIAELEAEEIVAALSEIRDYGDLSSMQNRIKSALTDDDIRALAAYIATLQDDPSQ